MMDTGPVRTIARLFGTVGTRCYPGQPVSRAAHMLQAAALAEAGRASPALIAAALLHDAGHFTEVITGRDLMPGADNRHGDVGADWLGQWFGPEVTEPIRLHVEAKRYLCAVEPGYIDTLSAAAMQTLSIQGGPMNPREAAVFEAEPAASAALRLRRWDDAAKDPARIIPPFAHFQPVLRRLVRPRGVADATR
jgi:gamma-butyrobetaine dioxygenase